MSKQMIKSALGSLLLFAILVSSAYAWLSMSNSVGSGNMGITITPVNDLTTMYCYSLQFDGICGVACYKIGDDVEHGEKSELKMTEFDEIFRDRNVNTPIIFVCEFANVIDADNAYIGIRIPCFQDYISLAQNGTTNSYVTSQGYDYTIQDYISNVVSLRIGCGKKLDNSPQPTTTDRIDSNVTIFNTAHNAFVDNNTEIGNNSLQIVVGASAETFSHVSLENQIITYTKDSILEIRMPNSVYRENIFEAEDDEGVESNHLIFYIQLDYDNALMDAYIESIASKDKHNATFSNDIGIIQIINGISN